MKERPILFSAPMVRALLDGSKTQTRRPMNPQPQAFGLGSGLQLPGYCSSTEDGFLRGAPIFKSRFGQPGDRLWVRETFCPIYPQDPTYNGGRPIEYDYSATYTHGDRLGDSLGIKKVWKPSIHMPRDASRITLEIISVRVERLQGISEADAQAEGCTQNHNGYYWGGPHAVSGLKQMATAVSAYRDLWQSINGPDSWDLNPWVWCISFRRIDAS